MQEIINCPSCQRKLQVPETLLGQDVQCPTCGATFTASAGNQAAPRPLPASPPVSPDAGEAPLERSESRPHYDDYDDYSDVERPRRRRRDLLPHRGTTILVLGILSLVICQVILGPIAWVLGNQDLAEIRAGRMDPEGEGTVQAGRICGMIATFLGFGILLLYCLAFFGAIALQMGAQRR